MSSALQLGEITLDTEAGGGVLHGHDEAYGTERVSFSVAVTNTGPDESGPFGVEWRVDGTMQSGSTHRSLAPLESVWLQWWSYPLAEAEHDLVVDLAPEEADVRGTQGSMRFKVFHHPHGRAVAEGAEAYAEGWKEATLLVRVHDFMGHPMTSGDAVIQLLGHGKESQERGRVEDGIIDFGKVWVPDSGDCRLWITRPQGKVNQLHGTGEVDGSGSTVRLAFTQRHTEETHSYKTAHQATSTYGTKADVGWDFGVLSAGLEISAEHAESDTEEEGREYKVWKAEEELESRADATARDR
jgi:hypothetical protein